MRRTWRLIRGFEVRLRVLPVGDDRPEEPGGFVVETGREEQRVRSGTRRRGGKAQAPQPIDGDRAASRPAEPALELAVCGVIRVDSAVAEVADEDVAAESAERRRRPRDCPRRVKLATAD